MTKNINSQSLKIYFISPKSASSAYAFSLSDLIFSRKASLRYLSFNIRTFASLCKTANYSTAKALSKLAIPFSIIIYMSNSSKPNALSSFI